MPLMMGLGARPNQGKLLLIRPALTSSRKCVAQPPSSSQPSPQQGTQSCQLMCPTHEVPRKENQAVTASRKPPHCSHLHYKNNGLLTETDGTIQK